MPLHFTLDVAYVGNHGVRTSATYNLNVPTTVDQMGIGVNGRPEYQQFKRTADTHAVLRRLLLHVQRPAGEIEPPLHQRPGHHDRLYAGSRHELPDRRRRQHLELHQSAPQLRAHGFRPHQTFVQSYVYDLPFGVGKKWLNHGLAAKTIGGWQINGILTLMTGTPMTFGANGSSLNTPGATQTADQVAPVTILYGINTPSKGGSAWFSQASFVTAHRCALRNFGTEHPLRTGLLQRRSLHLQDLQLHGEDEDGDPR